MTARCINSIDIYLYVHLSSYQDTRFSAPLLWHCGFTQMSQYYWNLCRGVFVSASPFKVYCFHFIILKLNGT